MSPAIRFSTTAVLALAWSACGGARYRAAPGAPDYAAAARGGVAPASPDTAARVATGGVRAGEWDDNANYREFQTLLAQNRGVGLRPLDIRDRQFVIVRDSEGHGVPSCRLAIRDGAGHLAELTTLSSGRAILFPRDTALAAPDVTVEATCGQETVRRAVALSEGEGVIQLQLRTPRSIAARPTPARPTVAMPSIDLVFVLDTTGSMSEEISGVLATLRTVAGGANELGANVRVAIVEYKDHGDTFLTRVHPFTGDLSAFRAQVAGIRASGGGDLPEDVDAGLDAAVRKLDWNPGAVARLAFLIGDAPPHRGAREVGYDASARAAARRGIQLFTIAASGMDAYGQLVWRQIAQYTGGTNMFVLRGGAGPQSTGAGDPMSSCGGTQRGYTSANLDQLVLGKLRAAVAALDADPAEIPGLGADEKSRPCTQRAVARSR